MSDQPPQKLGSFGLSDVINLVALGIALGSFYVAIVAYQKSIKDGAEQQKSLDVSREQLQAVVETTKKQQEILSQNLETSKAQQELLSKSLETSKIQQEIQRKHLETSKAELGVLEEQQKREAERQARKPIVEIALQTQAGRTPLVDLEKQPIEFILDKNKNWLRIVFFVSNKGNVEISRPIVRIVASPDTVFIDEPDAHVAERAGHNAFQFSGLATNDIAPVEVSGVPYIYAVDITVPDSINSFDLDFSIHGSNLSRKKTYAASQGSKTIFLILVNKVWQYPFL
jgi:hypothetical protein